MPGLCSKRRSRNGVRCEWGRREATAGLTLAEVLIASALFLLVSAVLMMTLRASQGHLKKNDEHSEALRACLIAAEHLRSELGTAWVETPGIGEEAPQVVYRQPLHGTDGLVRVGPTGDIFWGPTRTVSLVNDRLMRDQGGDQRILCRLGSGATVNFKRTSQTLLEATVVSNLGSGFTLTRNLRLNNQY